jgi:hypothetical protein
MVTIDVAWIMAVVHAARLMRHLMASEDAAQRVIHRMALEHAVGLVRHQLASGHVALLVLPMIPTAMNVWRGLRKKIVTLLLRVVRIVIVGLFLPRVRLQLRVVRNQRLKNAMMMRDPLAPTLMETPYARKNVRVLLTIIPKAVNAPAGPIENIIPSTKPALTNVRVARGRGMISAPMVAREAVCVCLKGNK